MSATIITASYFLNRIGEPDERETDLRFWCRLALWQWRHEWREAEKADDYAKLDRLDRQYEMIVGL